MPPLYPARRQPPTRGACAILLLLAWPGAWSPAARADPLFDRAASLSRPPAEARVVGQGSGFFVSGDGLLLTAAHLVAGCRRIDVVDAVATPDATLLRADPLADVALLRSRDHTPALRLAARADGEGKLRIMGYPEDQPGLTVGHAVGLNRRALAFNPDNPRPEDELILQGAIRHGDSGGPIIGAGGVVVGLVRGILPDRADVQATYGLSEPDVGVGPGLAPIRALLGGMPLRSGKPAPVSASIVRVFCWK